MKSPRGPEQGSSSHAVSIEVAHITSIRFCKSLFGTCGRQITMTLLEYSLKRPIILSRWTTVLIIGVCILWVVIVTLVSVGTAGYENVVVPSTEFNNTIRNWYEIFDTGSLIPRSWNCSYSVIKVNEGCSPHYIYIESSCVLESWNSPLYSPRLQ